MKKFKKFAAMVAAMTMTATLAMPMVMSVNAANVTVMVQTNGDTQGSSNPDTEEHTYTAYQIFTGIYQLKPGKDAGSTNADDYEFKVTDLGKDATGLLENPNFLAFRAADDKESIGEIIAKLPTTPAPTNTQKAVAAAQALNGIVDGSKKADELAEILADAVSGGQMIDKTNGTEFAEGYYLIKDTYTGGNTNDKHDAVSKFILKVNAKKDGDGITIVPKKSYPEVIKKVKENTKDVDEYTGDTLGALETKVNKDIGKNTTDGTTTYKERWNDVADYNIGDDVPFQLYGSLPATLDDYDAYYYKFTDTLGATFEQPENVKVQIGSKTLEFTFNKNAEPPAYELPVADQLKAEAATTETTYAFASPEAQTKIYAALKNVTDYTGLEGSAKKAEYIHNNWSTLTGDTGALKDLGFANEAAAITATDTVIDAVTASASTDGNTRVTWDVSNHKLVVSIEDVKAYADVTNDTVITVNYNAKLGAGAVIGGDGQLNKVDLTYSNNPNSDYGPKNDNTEDTPGDTDTTPEDKVVVFTYEIDINKIDGSTNQNLSGAEFKLSKVENEKTKYVQVNSNGKVTGWTEKSEDASTLTSGADGLFKIIGLDSGSYTLTETNPPEGYNAPADPDFEVVLNATTVNTQDWATDASTVLTNITGTINTNINMVELDADANANRGDNGGVKGVIENNKGTALPSTGGIGTKLFYLGGGAMVAVAGVFLITKKRMGKEEK